jgi:four helix bundle protein
MKNNFKNYNFENLEVWKIALKITLEVYSLTKKFPSEEKFGLTSQFRRAATSIALNIAEGSGEPTSKLFILFIERAKASALECVACKKIAIELKYLKSKEVEILQELLQSEYFKLIGLKKSLKYP